MSLPESHPLEVAAVQFPEVMKKAQAEIDLVIGPGRLPELDDRRSLPYLECVLKEVYRYVEGHFLGLRLLRWV